MSAYLNPVLVKRMSLTNHLAIEILRAGVPEAIHLTLIDQAILCMREFCREGSGVAREGLLDGAIEAYQRCTAADVSGAFRADDLACAVFGEVLTLLDNQLAHIPVHVMTTVGGRRGRAMGFW
jgi:hypothetical protein